MQKGLDSLCETCIQIQEPAASVQQLSSLLFPCIGDGEETVPFFFLKKESANSVANLQDDVARVGMLSITVRQG